MPPIERVVTGVGAILVAAVLAGLTVRNRLASCRSFVAYLLAVLISDGLVVVSPQRFWRRDVWMFKESILNLLKLAMAVELMVRIFRHFPAAYAAVRRGMLLILVGLAVLVGLALRAGTDYVTVVGRLHPTINDGTVWILVCLGAFCLWYHLPLDSIHKAILIGLVPYLLLYSVVQRAVGALGWQRGEMFNRTAPVAYMTLLVYWAVIAWRQRPEGEAGSRIARLMEERKK